MIPRQRVLNEYRANSIKSYDLKDEKSGTYTYFCASLLMKGGTFYLSQDRIQEEYIAKGAGPV